MRGVSIVEVLLTAVLMALVLFALISIIPTSLACLRKSQTTVAAANLGRQLMETWASRPFSQLKGATPPPQVVQPDPLGPNYTEAVTIQPTADINVLDLRITITWNSGGPSGNGVLHYTTLVYNQANPW